MFSERENAALYRIEAGMSLDAEDAKVLASAYRIIETALKDAEAELFPVSDALAGGTWGIVPEKLVEYVTDLNDRIGKLEAELAASEKRKAELRIVFDATNPWISQFLPNTYRCMYCNTELRITMKPDSDDLLSVHSNTCIFVKAVKEEENIDTAKHRAANDLFDAVKDGW